MCNMISKNESKVKVFLVNFLVLFLDDIFYHFMVRKYSLSFDTKLIT